ncbi:Bestrophin, RFP-TM, chloride channel-domain-containing protein [Haematococcus lacustris]
MRQQQLGSSAGNHASAYRANGGLRTGLSRTLRAPVRAQAGDPNKPIQSNSTGTLSSQSGNVMVLSRVEEARKYFRTVYDFPQWQKHRSQYRLIDRLLQIPQSHIMQNIVPSLAWVAGVSSLVVGYMYAFDHDALPDGFPSLAPNLACTAFISNTSVALSLLLVFRTNASYGRWDEARKMWGGLLNRSRDIMRQGATLFPEDNPEAKKALARWMVAFARALRIHFQPEVTLESELSTILTPKELDMLKAAPHRPVKAIHAMSQVIQNVRMEPIHQMQMSSNLTFFHDVLGGCERLLRAPIPVSYTRHTARFLFFWLTLLPFALYGTVGPWTVPVVVGISAVLCGIEEIGVQCEEPFGILPLDVICNRIQADVMNTLKDDEDTKAVLQESMGLRLLPPPVPSPAFVANGNGNGKAQAGAPRKKELVLSDYLE